MVNESEKEDKTLTEAWKGEADSILVFPGVSSATVAALITESHKNPSPDSGDKPVTLLGQIYQQLAGVPLETLSRNLTTVINASFKPTDFAIGVMLWILSLVLSLTSALSATLLQQWA